MWQSHTSYQRGLTARENRTRTFVHSVHAETNAAAMVQGVERLMVTYKENKYSG